jgi:Ca2+-binding RTX toxin-like protein
MYGGDGDDVIYGEAGAEDMNGQNGDDQLFGGADSDNIKGQDGDDKLYGGAGIDTLTGGMGDDLFFFDQSLLDTGIDRIVDFAPGSDRLVLSGTIYTAIAGSELQANQFESIAGSTTANVVAAATNFNTRITYNINNGALAYDADGSGSLAATQFATLSKFNPYFPSDVASAQALFPALSNSDFIVLR